MPYPVKTLSIDVSKGLDGQIAPELLPAGSLLELTNCQYAKAGKIEQRTGFEAMPQSVGYGGVTVDTLDPLMVSTAFSAPVILGKSGAAGKPLIQYVGNTIDRWQEPQHTQAVAPIRTRRKTIAGDVNSVTDPDIASYGDFRVVTYYDAPKTCVRILLTNADGVTLQQFTVPSATRPRVVAPGSYFVVFYVLSGVLKATKLTPGSALTTAVTVAATAFSTGSYDVQLRGSEIDVVCCNALATSLYVSWNPTTMAVSRSGTVAVDSLNCVSILNDSAGTGNLMVAGNGTTGLNVYKLSASGAVSLTATYVIDAALVECRNVTGYCYGSAASNQFRIAAEQREDWVLDDAPQVLFAKRNASGFINYDIWLRQCAPVSRVFYNNGQYYLVVGLAPSGLQNTNYIMAMPPEAVPDQIPFPLYTGLPYPRAPQAVINRLCGSAQTSTTGGLTSVVAGASGTFVTALPRSIRIATEDLGYQGYSLVSTADLHDITFDDTAQFQQPAQYDNGLLVPNGITRHWDGATYAELGFAYYPPGVDSSVASGGGSMPAGTHDYVATYRYVDRQGRLYRSAPMPTPYSATVTAGQKLDVEVKSLSLTGHYCPNDPADIAAWNVAPSSIYVELWRLDSAGIYRIAGSAMNDLSRDTTTVRDTLSAASLEANEPLTNGGAIASGLLANDGPPGFCGGCWHQGRFVGINGADPTELWFSKPLENGQGLAFSEALVYKIPEAVEMLALASYSDRLFVFSSVGVFILVGEPINNLGTGGSLQHTQLSFRPVVQPKIAVTDLGVFYISDNDGTDSPSIHLVGAENKEFKAAHEILVSVTDVAYCPQRNQVWVLGSGSVFGAPATAAVYDTALGLWSTFSWGTASAPNQSLVNWDGAMVVVGALLAPWVQSFPANGGGDAMPTATTKDPNGNIIMSVGLPWICLGGRGNEWLLHEGRAIGESSGNFRFKIVNYYDFGATGATPMYIVNPTNPLDVKFKNDRRRQHAWRAVFSTEYTGADLSRAGFRLTEIRLTYALMDRFRPQGAQVAVKGV